MRKMRQVRRMQGWQSGMLARESGRIVDFGTQYTMYELALDDWQKAYKYDRLQPAWEYFDTPKPKTAMYGGHEIELA